MIFKFAFNVCVLVNLASLVGAGFALCGDRLFCLHSDSICK